MLKLLTKINKKESAIEKEYYVLFGKAVRWFKEDDHPYVHPIKAACKGEHTCYCEECDKMFCDSLHGVLRSDDEVLIVCPGDWVIEDNKNRYFLSNHENFKRDWLRVSQEDLPNDE